MRRFFFNIHDGVLIKDHDGSLHNGAEAAMDEAHQTARELLAEGVRRKHDRRQWSVEVENEDGELVGIVRLADVALAPKVTSDGEAEVQKPAS